MVSTRLIATGLLLAMLSFTVRAQDRSAETLASKGLIRSGGTYVLPAESELASAVRAIRLAKAKVDTDARERQQIEQKLTQARSAAGNIELEKKRLMDAARMETSRSSQQRYLKLAQEADLRLTQIARYRADGEARLRALGQASQIDYVNKVVAAAHLAETATRQYEKLTADDEVTRSLATLNATAKPPLKMGPTVAFITNVASIRKIRGEISSAVVPIRIMGRVPLVNVTLNGKVTREFTLDSGASLVVLPADMASEVGLEPTEKDPIIRMQLADGKVIEGHQMVLKTVKVGIFTVEDVDCAVMPKNLTAASPLLGGAFLHNFVYKLDPDAGQVHLAALPGRESKVKVGNEAELAPTPAPAPPSAGPVRPAVPPASAERRAPGEGVRIADGPAHHEETPGPDAVAMKEPAGPPPAKPQGPISAETRRVADYLEREYKRKLETPDWRQRALAVICLARLPHEEVTDRLFQLCNSDKSVLVRLIAWEALLARVPAGDEKQFHRFYNSTLNLAEKDAFHGAMRVALLDVLSCAPLNSRSQRIFQRLAMETNAWETHDIPTLRALGSALNEWKSGALARAMVNGMRDQNNAYRFDYILQAAQVGTVHARDLLSPSVWNPQAQDRMHVSSTELFSNIAGEYFQWLDKNRNEWAEARPPADSYTRLRPLYVDAPVTLEQLEQNPELWKPDLELGSANMKAFEVCFVVDATESMRDVLAWLSRDIRRMINALGETSLEPRIGVTFYRDTGDAFVTRSLPLTGNARQLTDFVSAMNADGGGDVPEEVLAGLREAYTKNRWSTNSSAGRVLVIIGDAPPHPDEVKATIELAAKAHESGFKVHAAKVTTEWGANDLATFDQIAAAGGGETVEVTFGRLGNVRYIDPRTKKEIPLVTIARPEAQFTIAPAPPADVPGEKILELILADAVNPKFRSRLRPLVKTLLAASEPASEPEKRLAFPANTPPLTEGRARGQGR